MAAPVERIYLSLYRQFLKEFTTAINPNDPLPVKVTGYSLEDADLEGEIIDWTLQYLNQKCCPPALATTIARSVLDEMQRPIKEDQQLRTECEEGMEVHYDPLRLMHAVISRVGAVCMRYFEEMESWVEGRGPCPCLPPLAPGPPFISSFAIKNHRRRMEDRHVAIEDLHSLFDIPSSCHVGYYAIFDGHHGHEAAAYSAAQLHGLVVHSKFYPKDPEAALRDALLQADEIFIRKCASSKLLSGTTALVALVWPRESLHVAWLGDSLGILVRSGGKIIQLVDPHTAERIDERKRIEAEGGVVIMHFNTWRINGTLAISRAIGDPDCKPHVSAMADVASYPLDGSEHFLILACDGLWDCVTAEQATSFVYDHLRHDPGNYAGIGKSLVQLAKSRASNDNISVVVVLLSSAEDILSAAPPPTAAAVPQHQQQREAPSSADGIAPHGAPLHQHFFANGTMEAEAEGRATSPLEGEGRRGRDLMTSSFYGADGNLFGDLGPETDVDLLDEDARPDVVLGRDAEGGGSPGADGQGERGEIAISEEVAIELLVEEEPEAGSGVEEAYDDSEEGEEEGEWKYVSVKLGGVGAVSSEVVLGEEPALDSIASEQKTEASVSQTLEQPVKVLDPVGVENGDFGYQEKLRCADKAEGLESEEKVCQDTDLEALQKFSLEENVDLKRDPLEGQNLEEEEGLEFAHSGLERDLRVELVETIDESAMESRLNPDAAEFVPISPTRNVVPESFSSAGREFDVFRKEAEACPGDIFDGVSPLPAKHIKNEEEANYHNELSKNLVEGEIDAYDADAVLSSSFNCVVQPVEKVKNVGSGREHSNQDPSGLNDEGENKENTQECEDKENIFLPIKSELGLITDEGGCQHGHKVENLEESLLGFVVPHSLTSPQVLVEDALVSKGVGESIYKVNQESELGLQEDALLETTLSTSEINQEIGEQFSKLHSIGTLSAGVMPGEQVGHFLADYQSGDQDLSLNCEKIEQKSVFEGHSSIIDDIHTIKSPEKIPYPGNDEKSFSFILEETTPIEVKEPIDSSPKEILLSEPRKELEEQASDMSNQYVLLADKPADQLSILEEHIEHHVDEKLHEECIEHHVDEKLHEEDIEHYMNRKYLEEQIEDHANEELHEKHVEHNVDEQLHEEHIECQVKELLNEKQIKSAQTVEPAIHNVYEQIQSLQIVESANNSILQNTASYLLEEVKRTNSEDVGEHIPKTLDIDMTEQEKTAECHVETSIDSQPLGMDLTSSVPGPVVPTELEAKTLDEKVLSLNLATDVHSLSETSLLSSLDAKSLMPDLVIPSDNLTANQGVFLEVKPPILDSALKSDVNEFSASTDEPITVKVETELKNFTENLELVDNLSNPCTEKLISVQEVSVMEPLTQVKEHSNAFSEETSVISNLSQQHPEDTVNESTKETTDVGAAFAALGTGPIVSTVIAPILPVECKSYAKKAVSLDKKSAEKNKVPSSSAGVAKVKSAAKSPMPPSRTSSAFAKPSNTSPTKVAGTVSSRPSTGDRKTLTQPVGKSQVSSKNVSAQLSSKPRTCVAKPSTAPTARPAPPKITAAKSGTAGTASSRQASAGGLSKSATTATKSSTTHMKVAEAKRTINGEANRLSSPNNSVPVRSAPRKAPLTNSTSATKPSTIPAKALLTARSTPPHKPASEMMSSKTKASNVLNGNTTKPARALTVPGSKSAVSSSAPAKKPAPIKTLSTSSSADPKKAKECANKHISASRASVGLSGARRSTDVKGNVASKMTAGKGHPSEVKKTMSNGTVLKKTVENLDSLKGMEVKMDLVISGHSNGVAVEAEEVTKVEGSAVQLCEGKEEVMLIVEEGVGVGEAM